MASLLNHTSLMRTLSDKERFKKDAICIMQGSCELIINLSSPIIKNIFKTPATVVFSTNNSEGLLLNRLSSFKNEKNPWVLNFITPGQMARAGFYYTGVKDRVECMYCFEKFDNWCHSDDPLVVHKRVSPYCAFFDEDQGKFNKTSICNTFLFRLLLLFKINNNDGIIANLYLYYRYTYVLYTTHNLNSGEFN